MDVDVHALAGAYVLDAVDDIERAAFERHLAQCETCATDVAELREAAVRLADPTWSVPPARMRDDVMAAISRTRQAGPRAATAAHDPRVSIARWRRFAAGAAAAGILAVGAGAASWAVQEQRVRDQQAIAAGAQAQTQRLQAVLSAPDAQTRTAALATGGRVTMIMSPGHNAAVLAVSADVAPAPDRAFQLWLLKDGTPIPSRVLPPGTAASTVLVQGLAGHQGLAVSEESSSGAQTPSRVLAALLLP